MSKNRFVKRSQRWILLTVVSLCIYAGASAQVTIVLKNAADFSDSVQQKLYVSGNFNEWNPGLEAYHLIKQNNSWSVTFTPDASMVYVEFKFTRGDWSKGEVLRDGGYKPNRSYYYKPGMILEETVESFQDLAPKKVIEPNKNVIQFNMYSEELKREKNIRVYLPCDYATDIKQYPVLYMLDGQNLFDDVYAYSGEWGVDENMDSICRMKKTSPAIIVGIDHAGEKRVTEYSPWETTTGYGGGEGDEFADFVANTLKPRIDSMYRTLPDRENTAVAGSSMGGLESLYIVLNHPEQFSKGGIFSPAFWTSEGNFENATQYHSDLPVKLYFICGAMEGDDAKYMKDMERMYDILMDKRIQNMELRLIVESDGTHSEKFWRSEFIDCYEWLFEK